jgi:glutaredoxin
MLNESFRHTKHAILSVASSHSLHLLSNTSNLQHPVNQIIKQMNSSWLQLHAVFLCATSHAWLAPHTRCFIHTSYIQQRRLQVGTLQMSIPTPLDTLTSGLASMCRMPAGVTVDATVVETTKYKLQRLYDIENDAECRRVRETITELDLCVDRMVPAARNSRVFSDATFKYALPKDAIIPRLQVESFLDGNVKVLSGATEICEFLQSNFLNTSLQLLSNDNGNDNNDATTPQSIILDSVRHGGMYAAQLLRTGRGCTVVAAATNASRPLQPLALYSYEGNQFCRLVREVLTELDLVYELRSAGKLSSRRAELAKITGGSSQCPFLIDPNTGIQIAESASIVQYLYKNYASWTPPNYVLQWVSKVILPAAKPLFQVLAPLQAGSSRENKDDYKLEIAQARSEIDSTLRANSVVVYTYAWSPFSAECKALLNSVDIAYKEICLGPEWFLLNNGGATTRAALLEMTGQSSLPQIFIGCKSIGGLFSGTPGLVPSLEAGPLKSIIANAGQVVVANG